MIQKVLDQREENHFNGKDFLMLGDYRIREHAYNQHSDKITRVCTYSVFKLDDLKQYFFKLVFKTTLFRSGNIMEENQFIMNENEKVLSDMIRKILETTWYFEIKEN